MLVVCIYCLYIHFLKIYFQFTLCTVYDAIANFPNVGWIKAFLFFAIVMAVDILSNDAYLFLIYILKYSSANSLYKCWTDMTLIYSVSTWHYFKQHCRTPVNKISLVIDCPVAVENKRVGNEMYLFIPQMVSSSLQIRRLKKPPVHCEITHS